MPGLLIALIAMTALPLSGCQKPDEIRQYTVAKPPPRETRPADSTSVPNGNAAAPVATDEPAQLLGAIIPHGKMTWFFKLTGPSQAVESQMEPFFMFLRSITFSEKGPDWALPNGWKAAPGSQMRFATIRIAADEGPLEMSVIPLPTGEGSFDAYLLSNVNRWRGQFGLGPIAEDQLAEHARKIELGETMWLVKFEGHMAQTGMGAAPFAGNPAGKTSESGSDPRGAAPGRDATPFDCQIPDGWIAGQAGQFQQAVYDVRDGDRKVTISVSAVGGDLVENVNRWREQVQLTRLEAADLEKEMSKIKVDGNDAIYVEAIGPDNAKLRETILGVIVEAQGRQWFLKLRGDAELAAREKPKFERFVKSIRFRGK